MGKSQWMPRITQTVCRNCGECITQCPTGALGWSAGKASLLYPELCTYCATCETGCPVGAIELPYLVLKATDLHRGNHEQ